jgi:hypothetical protein
MPAAAGAGWKARRMKAQGTRALIPSDQDERGEILDARIPERAARPRRACAARRRKAEQNVCFIASTCASP